jgi:hypothetical protein
MDTRTFEDGDYVHTFSDAWAFDAENHWHSCACGEKTELIPHTWDAGTVTLQPTCSATGNKVYTCACGATKNETLPVAHKLGYIIKLDSTCTTVGNVEHWHCANCNKKFSDAEGKTEISAASAVIPVKAHDFVNGTWISDGENHKKKCVGCNLTTEAEAHVFNAKRDSEKHWSECVCGAKINEGAHALDLNKNDGYHWFECGCGYVTEMHEHETHELIQTLEEPSCTTDGSALYECVCTVQFVASIPASHTFNPDGSLTVHIEATEESCTESGNHEYWQCETCSKYYADKEAKTEITDLSVMIIAAKGHSYTVPKCDANEHWYECANCQEKNTATVEKHYNVHKKDDKQHWDECVVCSYPTEKIDHDLKVVIEDEQHYSKCSCGYNTDKADHVFNEGEVTQGATCVSDGVITYTCECGKTKTEAIIGGHATLVHTEGKDATCTEEGKLEYWYCEKCDKYFFDEEAENEMTSIELSVIEALGHSFTEWVYTESTHAKECERCGLDTEAQNHVIKQYAHDSEYHWIGCECGYVSSGEKAAHKLVANVDGDFHSFSCEDCDYVSDVVYHSFVLKHTETEHWYECACGVKDTAPAEAHVFNEAFNSTHHYMQCECGFVKDKKAHTLSVRGDEEYHWYVCSECDYVSLPEEHKLTGKYNAHTHWDECSCGYVTNQAPHVLVSVSNETHYWGKCSCGYETEKLRKTNKE